MTYPGNRPNDVAGNLADNWRLAERYVNETVTPEIIEQRLKALMDGAAAKSTRPDKVDDIELLHDKPSAAELIAVGVPPRGQQQPDDSDLRSVTLTVPRVMSAPTSLPTYQPETRSPVPRSGVGFVGYRGSRRGQEIQSLLEAIRRPFNGLRQVTVVNPKGGAGKTVTALTLAMTLGTTRGGFVLAWDNNETQGTLGMRAQQDFHSRTVRDLLRDLHQLANPSSTFGNLSKYARAQGAMFDVLASDESATAGEMLTADAFVRIREVVARFYKLIVVDTGNNVRAENWQTAAETTDQLVITMSARRDSVSTAARMLDYLEQTGRTHLARQAVTIISMLPAKGSLDVEDIERYFAARTKTVCIVPYDAALDTGNPIEFHKLSKKSRRAWLAVAANVIDGC